MQALLDGWIAQGVFGSLPPAIVYAIGIVAAAAAVIFGFVLNVAGVTTFVERRVWARIQSRIGPNRVGPQGILQWLADGLKLLMKEELVPAEADAKLFKLAPYVVVMGFVAAFVAMPFSSALIAADLNVGILYITAVTSLVVVGILMAGWASNNKWALIGGIRAAAQIVSYEIPAALSIFPIVLITGTLSTQGIIQAQGWAPWSWFLFYNPFTFVAFWVLFTALLAEGNRTPFDLPEAESELVAGFVTEYSGARYLFFFLVEWGNLYVISAVLVTLFLGGWQVPPVTDNPVLLNLLQFLTFFLKSYFGVILMMWIRATLPRIRVDQLMTTCWKYLVPIAFVNFLGTAVWVAIWPHGNQPVWYLMTAGGFALVGYFFYRVFFHLRRSGATLLLSPFS
ncbi:MAG: NADH-quinone oxidoreductase subunit NuoH [Candidatus Binatia bacterium]